MIKDSFIGSEFNTPSGGILTVKESYVNENNRKRYVCECSLCSKDKELWPYGSINSPKFNLEVGNTPCACSKPRWKEFQWKIRVQRKCDEKGYVFNGWYGDYKGCATKLNLYNPETNNTWYSLSAEKLLCGQGDPKTPHHLAQRNPDEYYINMFMSSGKFPVGTVFTRDNITKDKYDCYSYWDVECPVCKEDIFSQNGFSYTFKASNTSLRDGARPCRCYKGYTKTEDEIIFMINHLCATEGHAFLGFESGYSTVKETYINWICVEGHRNNTNLYDFLTNGVRCRTCYNNIPRTRNGYYKDRLDEDDYLYVMGITRGEEYFIKVGRSFVATKRPRDLDLKSVIKADKIEYISKWLGRHEDIWHFENEILNKFREDFRYFEVGAFKGSSECLKSDCTGNLICFVENNKSRYNVISMEEI